MVFGWPGSADTDLAELTLHFPRRTEATGQFDCTLVRSGATYPQSAQSGSVVGLARGTGRGINGVCQDGRWRPTRPPRAPWVLRLTLDRLVDEAFQSGGGNGRIDWYREFELAILMNDLRRARLDIDTRDGTWEWFGAM